MNQNNESLYIGQKNRLRKAVSERIYQLTNNPGARPVLFRSLYGDLKQRYKVESYQSIKQRDLPDALNYISKWGR